MASKIIIDTNYDYILLSANFTEKLNATSNDKLYDSAEGFFKLNMTSKGMEEFKFFGESADIVDSTNVFEALGELDSRIANKPSALMKTFFMRSTDFELFSPAAIMDCINQAWNTEYLPDSRAISVIDEYVAEMEDKSGEKIRVLVFVI